MPGTNLTRDEARERARLLAVDSYEVSLDLTTSTTTFASTTTLRFRCTEPGSETFADLVDAEVHEITLNGAALDPATAYADGRIALRDLQEENELVVRADCAYSHTGEGLHRFVDPVDDRVYCYTQFEVPDARRVYTTFEQPDLKSVFTFHVTAPASWLVASNAPTPQPVPACGADGTEAQVWHFPPTRRISTYITAVVAGEYHAEFDTYRGRFGEVPLGHYCRQSLREHMDTAELVKTTQAGFAYFEDAFDMAYPFEKYDQLYVPEYNMGAMENAGCVTLRDEYLPRSRQVRSFYEYRSSVILHEMAHMWFGDLVTMRWWDDLWLNESFAEWACYAAEAVCTEFTDAWTGFANARKQTGYRADQLPSTHPIAADNEDLRAVEVNFDMITYAKGASVLKQLVAWVGLEPFLAGLRQYFADHAYANSEFSDLLFALEQASGRELQGWAQEWLQTAGVNTLEPEIEVDEQGRYTAFAVRQSAPESHPTLRRHRLGIGLYDAEAGSAAGPDGTGPLTRRRYVEVDVTGARTELPELVGETQPELLLLNDSDHAYAKIRLDERSRRTVVTGISRLQDSLARALCWGSAWDMTRDGEMPAREFVDLVLRGVAAETDSWAVSRLPAYAGQAVHLLSSPAYRPELARRWEQGLRRLVHEAEAGSDHQLSFLRAYAANAFSTEAVDELAGLLDGSVTLAGLEVDQDLRWTLLGALARTGRAGQEEIDAEQKRDGTISGQEDAAAATARRPDAAAKAESWRRAMLEETTPNETSRSIAFSFMNHDQDEVLQPYVEQYLEAVPGAWDRLGAHRAAVSVDGLFPRVLASAELVERVERWLAETEVNPGAERLVREGLADVRRYLHAQERDAAED